MTNMFLKHWPDESKIVLVIRKVISTLNISNETRSATTTSDTSLNAAEPELRHIDCEVINCQLVQWGA